MDITQFSWSRFWAYIRQPKVILIILEVIIVFSLVASVATERLVIAYQRRIMPAGDVFNYQSIARNMRYFDYPINEKRLPGFPIVLLVGTELGFDPTLVGIAISIISSAGATVVLYLLGRHLKLPLLPLSVCLFLTSVAPLLTINGVRPLADSYFMFLLLLCVYLTTVMKPTKGWAIGVGLVFMLTAFTRYEGVPTILLFILMLRLRVPWKYVGIVALPLFIAGLLWLPVTKKIYGSVQNFGYFRDAREVASVQKVPAEYIHIVSSSGFGQFWEIMNLRSDNNDERADAEKLLRAPVWWISALATFGVIWLVVYGRLKALPILVAFALYPIIPAWWFTYSRYVAPMSAFYFFAVAVGAAGVWMLVSRSLPKTPSFVKGVAAVVLAGVLIQTVWGAVPPLVKEAQARGFDNNGRGYSMYLALKSLQHGQERVALSYDYLVATMMFGNFNSPKSSRNPARGAYLSFNSEADVIEQVTYLQKNDIDVVVDNGEKDLQPVLEYLKAHHLIDHSVLFEWPRQDKEIDRTELHYLVK